jgi:hypothetical protein
MHESVPRRFHHFASQDAVSAVQAATDARIAAAEARTMRMQAQLEQLLQQLELKDKEIEGIFVQVSPARHSHLTRTPF